MHAKPQPEHLWLQKFVGEWTYESEGLMAPGQPPWKSGGTDSVRALGELWVLCSGRGEMPGGGIADSVMTLGFDPKRKRFVGTWVGSMMTHLWVYDGSLDAAGNVLTLSADGPDFVKEGATARYQDIIEFKGNDHRVLSSRVQGEDGSWTQFMTAHYRRTP